MEKDYATDMDANLKRRHEIYEEMENLSFDPSLPASESYQDYCNRYAQLREEMLWLYSLIPKETCLQYIRRTTNQWARQTGALWMLWVTLVGGMIAMMSGLSKVSGSYPELGFVDIIVGLLVTVLSFWILTYRSHP